MLNAGKFNKPITIYQEIDGKDAYGFPDKTQQEILSCYANVKTTRGFTIIANNSDFEKALTNFTIRYTPTVENAYYKGVNSNRDLIVSYGNKTYSVEYLNNVDEANIELEMQCKEVLH